MASKVDAALLRALSVEVEAFYWRLYQHGTGERFHAFVEFCGLMSEYLKMVSDAVLERELWELNRHTGLTVEVPAYRLLYFAEKLGCILKPFLRGRDPKLVRDVVERIVGEVDWG